MAQKIHNHELSVPFFETDEKRISNILPILARCPANTPFENLKELIKPFVEEWRIKDILKRLCQMKIVYYDRSKKVYHIQEEYRDDYLSKPIPEFDSPDQYHTWLQSFAFSLSDLGEYHYAIDVLKQLRTLNPTSHRQLNNPIGQMYFIIGEYTKAISFTQPTDYSQLGLAHLYMGKIKEAYSYFLQQKNSTSTNNADIEANLGLYAHIRGDISKAIQHFDQQIEFAQYQSDTLMELVGLVNLGKAYINVRDHANAIAILEQASQMATSIRYVKSVVLEYLATAYLASHHTSQARTTLKQAQALGYRYTAYNTYILTGILLHQLGDTNAKKEFETAIHLLEKSTSQSFEKLYRLGLAHAGLGLYAKSHIKKASDYYRDALRQCNGQGVIQYELGLLGLLSDMDRLGAVYKAFNQPLER